MVVGIPKDNQPEDFPVSQILGRPLWEGIADVCTDKIGAMLRTPHFSVEQWQLRSSRMLGKVPVELNQLFWGILFRAWVAHNQQKSFNVNGLRFDPHLDYLAMKVFLQNIYGNMDLIDPTKNVLLHVFYKDKFDFQEVVTAILELNASEIISYLSTIGTNSLLIDGNSETVKLIKASLLKMWLHAKTTGWDILAGDTLSSN